MLSNKGGQLIQMELRHYFHILEVHRIVINFGVRLFLTLVTFVISY